MPPQHQTRWRSCIYISLVRSPPGNTRYDTLRVLLYQSRYRVTVRWHTPSPWPQNLVGEGSLTREMYEPPHLVGVTELEETGSAHERNRSKRALD